MSAASECTPLLANIDSEHSINDGTVRWRRVDAVPELTSMKPSSSIQITAWLWLGLRRDSPLTQSCR